MKLLALLGIVGLAVYLSVATRAMDAMPRGDAEVRSAAPHRTYIADVTAEQVPEGSVYHVRPTRSGRLADRDELSVAWRQAVHRGVPDQAGLRQQFLCHPLSVIARAKPTWDLETWRPTVGALRTMMAACNP
ncbi:MAG: DUF2599 domain-containing protein [Candidatus Nanopelagicales bacterium]